MPLGQQYCRQLRRDFSGLHANFPPNRPLVLGDYGIKRDDVFQRLGNIGQLGVRFEVVAGSSQSTFQYKSEGSVDIEFVAKGELRPGGIQAGRAGLEIHFSRQDSVFFSAAGCTITQMDDINAVGAALIGRLNEGRWEFDFLVVTSVVRAASTTAIASADRASEILLEAKLDAVQEIDLADAGVKLRTKRSKSTALEIVTANDQTPLMQLSRIRGFFREQFAPETAIVAPAAPTASFVFTTADDPSVAVDILPSLPKRFGEAAAVAEERIAPGEFRFEAVPAPFEVDRAISAYIPLLKACYALANQKPVAFPAGYEQIAEVRADALEMAEAMEGATPEVQEAVQNDVQAVEETVSDPTAFGFVVREQATGAILVCIRGTQTPREWLANFTAVPVPFSLVSGFGLVHMGFDRMYRSVRRSIQQALAGLPTDVRITSLGHSLGGAMATLAAVDYERNLGRQVVDLCTFGGPRVGKIFFRRNFNREILTAFRVTNQFDIVPHVPSVVTAWNHVGEEIEVDGDVDNPHSLDAYLQGLRNIGSVREVTPAGRPVPEMAGRTVVSIRIP